jgi:hypothetical protein
VEEEGMVELSAIADIGSTVSRERRPGRKGASAEEIKGRARMPCGSPVEERGRDGAL